MSSRVGIGLHQSFESLSADIRSRTLRCQAVRNFRTEKKKINDFFFFSLTKGHREKTHQAELEGKIQCDIVVEPRQARQRSQSEQPPESSLTFVLAIDRWQFQNSEFRIQIAFAVSTLITIRGFALRNAICALVVNNRNGSGSSDSLSACTIVNSRSSSM